ncbi:MAG: tRNA (adenosine(37)-N6)-threonylcarbamoyltransferase complex ATPase subunit type 1 TsaE [Polymorphobacter sp.]|uniref:tRNA (adenosine(37)-N6)-threonylcarbamoyltransferase complex ATPase subunit type 1 TsaE n=1 Tax=Polymorphobacter sp. TaxID=1909290 RepID=UPI003A8C0AC3
MSQTGTLPLADEAATAALGAALAKVLRAGDCVALSGGLGAGKSFLARAVLRELGWAGDVPSPTFTLVQDYDLAPPVWHVDLYRLAGPDEAEALGLFETDAALLIEWPERLGARLPADALRLAIAGAGDEPRRLTWTAPTAWKDRWPPLLPPINA